jgi:hypothetical protein
MVNNFFKQRLDIVLPVANIPAGTEIVKKILEVRDGAEGFCNRYYKDVPEYNRSIEINVEVTGAPHTKRVDLVFNRKGWTAFFSNRNPAAAKQKINKYNAQPYDIYWSRKQSKFEDKMMSHIQNFFDNEVLP